jgi:hypothetical protein
MSTPTACGCGHPDAHADDCEGASLFGCVDLPRVTCLNERVPGSCRGVLRPLAERARRDAPPLRSQPGDADLLLVLPLTSVCRVKSVCVSGADDGSAPRLLRVWANREDLGWAEAEATPPTQELELPVDAAADAWHALRAARFGAVSSLTLLLRGTHGGGGGGDGGDGASAVYFVGLKGASSGLTRRLVEAVYEARPQLSDHQARADAGGGRVGM